ncbi:hypothetical protein AWC05_24420 [Mycobacterium florentinum]|uniref:Transmembrane protein n=1 Tax=Mycobacterium florentinum TaxID=292462 RepID=A0A1X1U724_MYCFL|nr:hypothetical protein [Mycobacterium florentinum]MCV7409708.1 hypothetical protein [Mycobacterium florentinum]ORV52624.1 hypothetical protein AWC05_24420 [Mycobacterium florentinum]BBX79005.1 hypothetical protein MFLOJ_27920 [Mycobacterium florentinum]
MADKKVEHDHVTNPGTEPFVPDFEDTGTRGFVPDFSDTGEHSVPFIPNFDDTGSQPISFAAQPDKADAKDAKNAGDAKTPAATGEVADPDPDAAGQSVQSVTVPGRYQYLKWWKLALVILGVWAATALVGLSLFYWWYHTIDKTPAVFMALVYVVACTVGGVMLAMVQGRPLISALSIAVMSGPFASVAAAAPLYGYYYCARTGHCLLGVIPY